MNKQVTSTKTRKQYCKPKIEQVRLVPEEAVLAACKVDGSSTGVDGGDICGIGVCSSGFGS